MYDYEGALKFIEKAIYFNTNDKYTYFKKACCLKNLDNYQEELKTFQTLIKEFSKNKGSNSGNSSIFNDVYNLMEGKISIEIGLYPRHYVPYHHKAEILYLLEKYDEAIEYFNKALKLNPKAQYIFNNLGLCYYIKARNELEIKNTDKIVELTKKNELAIKYFDKSIELFTKNPSAYYNKGLCHKEMGKFKEAFENFKMVNELNLKYFDSYNELGNCYYKCGNKEEAKNCYERRILNHPKDADAYNNLGNYSKDLKNYGEALNYYNKSIQFSVNNETFIFNKAFCLYLMENFDESIKNFEKITDINLNNRKY